MQWMHSNGFPRDSKVTLREKPAVSEGEKSIHYVAAKEDLQVRNPLLKIRKSREGIGAISNAHP